MPGAGNNSGGSLDARPMILAIGAGAGQAPYLAALAKEYELLGTDIDADAPGKIWLRHFLRVDAADDRVIIRFAENCAGSKSIERVVSFTSAAPQKAASAIALRLGVPGPSPALVDCALSKHKLSGAAARLGAGLGSAFMASSADEAERYLTSRSGRFYVKPDQGGGGDGVVLVQAPGVSRAAIVAAFAAAGGGKVVIEPEARGCEYIATLVIRNGHPSFFSLGRSIKLKNRFAIPIGQVLGAGEAERRASAPVLEFARRWIQAFDFQHGIIGFELLIDGDRVAVLDVDLSYYAPLQLARAAGNVSIPDRLVGNGGCLNAAGFPRASGLMHAVVSEEHAGTADLSQLVRGFAGRYPAGFVAAAGSPSSFRGDQGRFLRVGYWQIEGADQEAVKSRFQEIALDVYGSEVA